MDINIFDYANSEFVQKVFEQSIEEAFAAGQYFGSMEIACILVWACAIVLVICTAFWLFNFKKHLNKEKQNCDYKRYIELKEKFESEDNLNGNA